jgi:glycosyltransferase involved in cell wall biosynthesis
VITVLLPVYNGAETLESAIASVLRQEIDELELLVIDDRSTDGSAAVIRACEERDSRVRAIFHAENRGLSATLNEGLRLARFDLVARMDQDDECLPHRLRVQLEFMDANPAVVAAGSWAYHMGASPHLDRLVRLPASPSEIRQRLPAENCIYHPTVILRRDAILDLGGYREQFRNAEDYDLWLRAMDVHSLANIPEPLQLNRFSVRGMTLARKWEQLYYVFLAQSANQPTTRSFEAAETRANRIMSLVDRQTFLRHVAVETVSQLEELGWSDDARQLERAFMAP